MTRQDENTVRKSSPYAWQIHYHIVFPVKYRKVLLDEDVIKIIRETAVSIEERYPIELEALGTDKNHLHVLCSAHPKVAPGRIVQIFKSITVREIFRRHPAVKRELWGGENFGRMGITLRRLASVPTGRWWNVMSNGKVIPKKMPNN